MESAFSFRKDASSLASGSFLISFFTSFSSTLLNSNRGCADGTYPNAGIVIHKIRKSVHTLPILNMNDCILFMVL